MNNLIVRHRRENEFSRTRNSLTEACKSFVQLGILSPDRRYFKGVFWLTYELGGQEQSRETLRFNVRAPSAASTP